MFGRTSRKRRGPQTVGRPSSMKRGFQRIHSTRRAGAFRLRLIGFTALLVDASDHRIRGSLRSPLARVEAVCRPDVVVAQTATSRQGDRSPSSRDVRFTTSWDGVQMPSTPPRAACRHQAPFDPGSAAATTSSATNFRPGMSARQAGWCQCCWWAVGGGPDQPTMAAVLRRAAPR